MDDEREPVPSLMGACDRTPDTEEMTDWERGDNDTARIILPEYGDRTAATDAGTGYAAGLVTKPEHFCAMFQKRVTEG
ncbi:MAG: hypothetical protein OEZ19_03965 [Paracoccaceae bacterium]|nr:hypothetical protein [Paracoccaceae bacterium]